MVNCFCSPVLSGCILAHQLVLNIRLHSWVLHLLTILDNIGTWLSHLHGVWRQLLGLLREILLWSLSDAGLLVTEGKVRETVSGVLKLAASKLTGRRVQTRQRRIGLPQVHSHDTLL